MARNGLRHVHLLVIGFALGLTCLRTGLASDAPLPVTVRTGAEVFTHVTGSAPATAVSLRRTEVAARLATPVLRFEVEVGDRVEADAPLVLLECIDAEDARDTASARLQESRARARLARLRLERVGRLQAQGAATEDELDEARAERDASAATVAARRTELVQARRAVERCTVRAVESGVVAARHVDAGDFVQPGTALLTLVSEQDIEARVEVTGRDTRVLLKATERTFRADGNEYGLLDARRTGVIESTTGTEEIRLRFAAMAPKPGTAGRVYWRSRRKAIPPHLLVRRGDELGVFMVHEGEARFRAIAGAVEGRPAIAEIDEDALVIVEGRHAATNGMPVKVIE